MAPRCMTLCTCALQMILLTISRQFYCYENNSLAKAHSLYFMFHCCIILYIQVIDLFKPFTYNYLLGKDILVAPVVSNDTTLFKVDLPQGNNWIYWWNHSVVVTGGSSYYFSGGVPLQEFPVFFVNGMSN